MEPNTTYQYRVRASNAVGQSNLSNTLTVRTNPDDRPVGEPNIGTPTVGADSITVTWTDGENSASSLIVLLDAANNFELVGMEADPSGNTVTFSGLSTGTYVVVVFSIHQDGTYQRKNETIVVQ